MDHYLNGKRLFLRRLVVATLFALGAAAGFYFITRADRFTDPVPPTAARQTRSLTLDSGLKVFLISDPGAQQSSAAVAVGIGGHSDPADAPGMAHFVEHLLFLGTAKYPELGEFDSYLAAHQGYNNAMTGYEDTTYYFEVNHGGLQGSLDRFAQFFIAPQFSEARVDSELDAVQSEHDLSKQNDGWRLQRLMEWLTDSVHPRHRYFGGTRELLKSIRRDELLAFHKTYYQAQVMRLAVQSSYSLDELESWVRESFAPVAGGDTGRPDFEMGGLLMAQEPLEIRVQTVADIPFLKLEFELPSLLNLWREKPLDVIGRILNYGDENSLEAWLRKDQLITHMTTSDSQERYGTILEYSFALTKAGQSQVDEIARRFFAVINHLREQGIPRHVFAEVQTMRAFDYKYWEPSQRAGETAMLARLMLNQPADVMEERAWLVWNYAPDVYRDVLNRINPDHVHVFIGDKQQIPNAQHEPFLDVAYAVQPLSVAKREIWRQAMPPKAAIVSKPSRLVPSDHRVRMSAAAVGPKQLSSDVMGDLWFQPVERFRIPKASLHLRFQSPLHNRSVRSKVTAEMAMRLWKEALFAKREGLRAVGLDVELSEAEDGIEVMVDGYSQHLLTAAEEVVGRLGDTSQFGSFFDTQKLDLRRQFENVDIASAGSQVATYLSAASREPHYLPKDLLRELESVSLVEVEQWVPQFFSEIKILGLAVGNLHERAVMRLFHKIPQLLGGSRPYLGNEVLQPKDMWWKPGALAFRFSSRSDNHAFGEMFQCQSRQPSTEAALAVAEAFFSDHFFRTLRTEQRLGYSVSAALSGTHDVIAIQANIQSATASADVIAERVDAWRRQVVDDFKKLTDEEMTQLRTNVAIQYRKKPQTRTGEEAHLWFDLVSHKANFGYRSDVADQAEGLSRSEVEAALSHCLTDHSVPRLAVYHAAKGASLPMTREPRVEALREAYRPSPP